MEFTGYDPELENRDEIANTATAMAFSMRDFQAPEELDPRPLCRHDRQGNMGACQGFSLTNSGEYLWALHTGAMSNDRQFSQLFAYLESQRLDGLLGRDAGSTINSGVKIAKDVGYLRESELTYRTPYPSNARAIVTDGMRAKAGDFKIRSHTWLESYDAIFQYLASGSGAVHTGTLWNDSFYSQSGVLESVSLRIWRLNSHQDSWTEIAPSVIDALCKHQYTSIVGISDLTQPGPRKVSWVESRPLG